MGFIKDYYNKPGPGVGKDEPRKKGVSRFFEIITRDFVDLVKLNFLFFACCAPSVALFVCFIFGIGGVFSIAFLFLSLAAAFPIGGAAAACFFCIAKMLRDDPGFVGFDFKRKIKENFKLAMPAGILCALFFYGEIYILIIFTSVGAGLEPWMLAANTITLVFLGMILPYVFVQIPHLDLGRGALIKNSLIFAFRYAPRSLMSSVLGNVIWALYAFFFPFSILFSPFIAIVAFALSWLLALMWVWKPVDEQFKIEETLAKRKEGLPHGEP